MNVIWLRRGVEVRFVMDGWIRRSIENGHKSKIGHEERMRKEMKIIYNAVQ